MENKKWDGVLDITYKNKKKDIFYYDVTISFSKKKVTFVLPRYHPMIGWIEVFGLPPQNEWVFLDNEKTSWHKTTPFSFVVNGKKYVMEESLNVWPDLSHNRRSLELVRVLGKVKEVQWYEEDWSMMKTKNTMTKRSVFKHEKGLYFVDATLSFNPSTTMLTKQERDFLSSIKKKYGNPTLGVWLKHSTMSGEYPSLYSKLFPFWNKDILGAKESRSIELGYEENQSHGNWYKLFTLGNRVFEIEEDNYSERDEIYNGKKVSIKNTYRKKIRQLYD